MGQALDKLSHYVDDEAARPYISREGAIIVLEAARLAARRGNEADVVDYANGEISVSELLEASGVETALAEAIGDAIL